MSTESHMTSDNVPFTQKQLDALGQAVFVLETEGFDADATVIRALIARSSPNADTMEAYLRERMKVARDLEEQAANPINASFAAGVAHALEQVLLYLRSIPNAGIEWQPIETVPRDGTAVDLWAEGMRWTDWRWLSSSPLYPNGSWVQDILDWSRGQDIQPSHWRPTPAPPGMVPTRSTIEKKP